MAASVKLPSARPPKRKAWTSDEARRFLESARAAQDVLYAANLLVSSCSGYARARCSGSPGMTSTLDQAELTVGRNKEGNQGDDGSDATRR